MKWIRKSKYHWESDPHGYYVAAAKGKDGWRFSLTDQTELVGWYDTSDEAKAKAESIFEGEA